VVLSHPYWRDLGGRMDKHLIYDVGAYDGADTAYYLRQGYRVVSIEADPTLADELRTRFATEVSAGHCTILNVGVADEAGEATFYVSELPIWSSFDKAMATRAGFAAREIRVECRTFQSIMQKHGVPFFLKVDIEGHDHLCVLAQSRSR
jgi:FkbM family methyltransferase